MWASFSKSTYWCDAQVSTNHMYLHFYMVTLALVQSLTEEWLYFHGLNITFVTPND